MASNMRISSVELETDVRLYTFSLSGPCTVIDGPIGTGKSSLLELIKYGFGGSGNLMRVVKGNVRAVRTHLMIGDSAYVLRRGIGEDSNRVHVIDPVGEELIETCSVRPTLSASSISDFLLERLGFPSVRIPRARSRSTGESVPLTFGDLYTYLYVEQNEIDRSVVHHVEVFREPKRRAVFELLFGLSDPGMMQLEVELGSKKDEVKTARALAAASATFLSGANVPPEISLEVSRDQHERAAAAASAELDALRQQVARSTSAQSELRNSVQELERSVAAAETTLAEVSKESEARRQRVAQLHLDLARADRASAATQRLGFLEFVTCPKCFQDLDETRGQHGECVLCLQEVVTDEEPVGSPNADIYEEELAEAEGLQEAARENELEARMELSTRREALVQARERLDTVTQSSVTPLFAEIELLSAQRAESSAESRRLSELLGYWQKLSSLHGQVDELGAEVIELQARLDHRASNMPDRQSVIDDISEIFAEMVSILQVPWAESAHIDQNDFLPRVNGEKFEEIAVAGGTKTLITVAYHLALLTYALAQQTTLLPTLLILDTPKKNLGASPEDRALSERIYGRIRTLCDAYGARVQFLIADNDVPGSSDWITRIHLDYDQPLIAHVAHPGEAAVLAGDIQTV